MVSQISGCKTGNEIALHVTQSDRAGGRGQHHQHDGKHAMRHRRADDQRQRAHADHRQRIGDKVPDLETGQHFGTLPFGRNLVDDLQAGAVGQGQQVSAYSVGINQAGSLSFSVRSKLSRANDARTGTCQGRRTPSSNIVSPQFGSCSEPFDMWRTWTLNHFACQPSVLTNS